MCMENAFIFIKQQFEIFFFCTMLSRQGASVSIFFDFKIEQNDRKTERKQTILKTEEEIWVSVHKTVFTPD